MRSSRGTRGARAACIAPLLFAPFGAVLLACAAGQARAGEAFLEPRASVAAVLELEDRRLALMPAVAAWKWRRHAPVADPARERAVIDRAVDAGAAFGLASEGLRALFALQVRLARESEQTLHERWAREGAAPPGNAPDLEGVIRPELDALSEQLLRALYLAAPVLAAGELESRFPGLGEERLREAAWTDASRAELLGALGAVRRTPLPALARIARSGVLRVGTSGDYEPWSLEAEGSLAGSDIELARAIAGRLGARAVFVRTSWRGLLEDLAADRFDLAVGGISVTPERAAVAAFSEPYAVGGKTLIARCRDARRYRNLAAIDRPGVRIAVNPGGTNQQFVDARIHRASVHLHEDNRSLFDELLEGRADVIVTDDVEAWLQARRHPQLCRTTRDTFTRTGKAILLPRDPEFDAAVDAALRAEIAAGRVSPTRSLVRGGTYSPSGAIVVH